LQKLLTDPGPHSLLWYHRVGELVNNIRSDHRSRYGGYKKLLEELVKSYRSAPGTGDAKLHTLRSVLDKSRSIAANYAPAQLKRFERPQKGDSPLTWSHLRLIATLPAPDRNYFEKQVVGQGWSVARLQLEIRRRCGRKKAGGRKHRELEIDQLVRQFVLDCETWVRMVNSHWLSENSTVTAEQLRDFRTTSQAELSQALAVLRKLRAAAVALSKRLDGTES